MLALVPRLFARSMTAKMKLAILIAAALAASIAASARAQQGGDFLHFSDPVPPAIHKQFFDQVIIPNKCPDWNDAVDAELDMEEQNQAIEACWLDFIASARAQGQIISPIEADPAADGLPQQYKDPSVPATDEHRLPRFSTDPIPQELYLKFRNEVILAGKCEGYDRAQAPVTEQARKWKPGDPPVTFSPEMLAEMNDALDDCFRDWLAPRL
jgi:hypothetical protein